MKKCPYCDKEIQDEAIRCKHCQSDIIKCPYCAEEIPALALRCMHCKHEIERPIKGQLEAGKKIETSKPPKDWMLLLSIIQTILLALILWFVISPRWVISHKKFTESNDKRRPELLKSIPMVKIYGSVDVDVQGPVEVEGRVECEK